MKPVLIYICQFLPILTYVAYILLKYKRLVIIVSPIILLLIIFFTKTTDLTVLRLGENDSLFIYTILSFFILILYDALRLYRKVLSGFILLAFIILNILLVWSGIAQILSDLGLTID